MTGKLIAAGIALAAAAWAQGAKVPGWFLAGSNPKAFAIHVDDDVRHGGNASANIRCVQDRCGGFGTLMQTFSALEYRGQRLRLTAWVKAAKAGRANIWMRVDGGDGTLTFDNMEHRQTRGTFEWRQQQIVLDVPDDALTINYGLILDGRGQAWVDDFVFEIVEKRVRSTNLIRQPAVSPRGGISPERFRRLPQFAVNADFEQPPEL